MSIDQSILDDLTPEERDALNEPDGGTSATLGDSLDKTDDDNKGNDHVNTGADEGKTGDDGAAADDQPGGTDGDGEGADDAGSSDGAGPGGDATGNPSDAPLVADAPAPLLVAEMPENAEATFKAIGEKKGSLLEQHENGDITTREYHEQMEALNKEQRDLERAIDKATTAQEMRQQQEINAWVAQAKDFTHKQHPEYATSKVRYMALDAFVREVGADPANASLSAQQIFEKAHAMVEADLGAAPKATSKDGGKDIKGKAGDDLNAAGRPLKGAKVEQPKTLRDVPAAAPNDTGDAGKWAALDRLQESDPEAHEDRLMKMSEADRDAYLAHSR
jgi:hypothetical protein